MKNCLFVAVGITMSIVLTIVIGPAEGVEKRNMDFNQLERLFEVLPPNGWVTTRKSDGTYVFTYPFLLEFDSLDQKPISEITVGVVNAVQFEGTLRITTADIANMMVKQTEGHLKLPVLKALMRLLLYDGHTIMLNFRFYPTAVLTYEGETVLVRLQVKCNAAGDEFLPRVVSAICSRFAARHAPATFRVPVQMVDGIIERLSGKSR